MKIISDLHIHGRYSRATSKALDVANLEKWARVKGVDLLGTGDFTHPTWIEHLKANLKEDQETGILQTKTGFNFILQTEISLVYTQNDKGRRVHVVVLAPSLEVVNQITDYLKSKGRIDYDGRPIFKISCIEFTEDLKKISEDIEIIPAHIWTPWFALFGSKSGFDTINEAFGDQVKNIHALETGLSSDPAMNWRLSQLDRFQLVSFSDLHSFWPWRMAREATIFDLEKLSYKGIIKALRTGQGLSGTIEVDPSYGKYHFDGHRNCNIHFSPEEALKHNNICPVCKRPLTLGVLHRIEELADRPEGYKPKNAKPFKRLIPLSEILAGLYKTTMATKKVWSEYNTLLKAFASEYDILLNASPDALKKVTDEKIADAILKNRQGKLKVIPGFDGVYGVPVFNEADMPVQKQETEIKKKQKGLNDFF
ncbi:MAG: endonuclease Q family protein [archaeon]